MSFTYPFPMTSTTATMVIINKDTQEILLGKRASSAQMFPDCWSLPGGFLDAKSKINPGEEIENTCAREMLEETSIRITQLRRFKLFGVNSDPKDDPRAHVVNLWYLIEITNEEAQQAKAGDDLQELKWVPIESRAQIEELAFNHSSILLDGITFYNKVTSNRYLRYVTDDKVALGVVRIEPLHNGHTRMINKMIQDYDVVIIGVGSASSPVSKKNPWTFEQRKTMLKQVYGTRIKILPIEDIGAEANSNSWCDHVLNKIDQVNLPAPTDYFTGSEADSIWYRGRFGDNIHIIERTESDFISGTEIRKYLEMGSDKWKNFVPRVNVRYIEDTYPKEFKIA